MERKEEILRKFGERVTELRLRKNLSLRELAIAAGLERNKMQRIEEGKVNILFTTILALAGALGITPEELMEFL
jgi:transcriptional regulator with XRE-family HTH domain